LGCPYESSNEFLIKTNYILFIIFYLLGCPYETLKHKLMTLKGLNILPASL